MGKDTGKVIAFFDIMSGEGIFTSDPQKAEAHFKKVRARQKKEREKSKKINDGDSTNA